MSFENKDDREVRTGYYLPKVKIKDYNVMVDGKNFSNQPVKSNMRIFNDVRKTSIGQGDDYTTGCLLDKYYKMNIYYKSINTIK